MELRDRDAAAAERSSLPGLGSAPGPARAPAHSVELLQRAPRASAPVPRGQGGFEAAGPHQGLSFSAAQGHVAQRSRDAHSPARSRTHTHARTHAPAGSSEFPA